MPPPDLGFNSGSPVYPLYQALHDAGVTDAEMNVGHVPRTGPADAELAARVGANDATLEDIEVFTYAAERSEALQSIVSGWSHVDLPAWTAELRALADTAITELQAMARAAHPNDRDQQTSALAFALYSFVQFPTAKTWTMLPEKVRAQVLATYRLEGEQQGLPTLLPWLQTTGGLGLGWEIMATEVGDMGTGPTDFQQSVVGFRGNRAPFLLAEFLRRAGLTPQYYELLLRTNPRNPCDLLFIAIPAVGITTQGRSRLFVPGSWAGYPIETAPRYELSRADWEARQLVGYATTNPRHHRVAIQWLRSHSADAASQSLEIIPAMAAIVNGQTTLTEGVKALFAIAPRSVAGIYSLMGLLLLALPVKDLGAEIEAMLARIDRSRWLSPPLHRLTEATVAMAYRRYDEAEIIANAVLREHPQCFPAQRLLLWSAIEQEQWPLISARADRVREYLAPQSFPIDLTFYAAKAAIYQRQWVRAGQMYQGLAQRPNLDTDDRATALRGYAAAVGNAPQHFPVPYVTLLGQYADAIRAQAVAQPVKDTQDEWQGYSKLVANGLWPTSHPDDPTRTTAEAQVLMAFAQAFAWHGDLVQAETLAMQAAERTPDDGDVYLELVAIWARRGNAARVGPGLGDHETFRAERKRPPPETPAAEPTPSPVRPRPSIDF